MRPFLLALCLCLPAMARAESPLDSLHFLLGTWVPEDPASQGTGEVTFQSALDGKVILRTNHAEIPAKGGGALQKHDDLLTVYVEGGAAHALYTDNEGHVIHYTVTASPTGVTFESEGTEKQMRFKLVYASAEGGKVRFEFLIAPPGKPFGPYLSATLKRKG